MKNKVLKSVRVMALSLAAVVMVVVGCLSVGVGANASKAMADTDVVKYVEYADDITSYLNNNTAPKYMGDDVNGFGYLFGGWYYKNGDQYTSIAETTDIDSSKGTVVAKFVPAQTLSVKCQNWAGTAKGDEDVIVRVISATDSTNYSNFGFIVSRIIDGEEELLTQEPFTTTDVYSKFNYYKDDTDTEPTATYEPSQLFGKAAKHFTTCTIGKIPSTAHGTIICIKPFWVTLDGTTVYGLSKFAHVEDGYLHYVNVPVNLNILNQDSVAAAGILSVTSDDSLEFVGGEKGVECGKVFDEMRFNEQSDGTIKCVGNTSDISEKNEMDVYINLKFKRKETDTDAPIADKFYTFTVGEEDFCGKDETSLKEQDVWNVIY